MSIYQSIENEKQTRPISFVYLLSSFSVAAEIDAETAAAEIDAASL